MDEFVLQGLGAAGVAGAVYLASPLGSGLRELDLMVELAVFTRSELRSSHAERWRHEVLQPNVAAARSAAQSLRRRIGQPVVDPSHFEVPGFSQDDYDRLCARVITGHVKSLALLDGWQFSRGARVEVSLAFSAGLTVTDFLGENVSLARAVSLTEQAQSEAAIRGVPPEFLPALLPPITQRQSAPMPI